jgi:hypothetical protein
MATCGNCLQAIPEGQEKYISGKNNMRITLCSACVTKIETAIHSETQGANAVNALALALGAGLVSALVWYGIVVVTEYQLGIIAVGVGWLVAQAAIFGAGRRRGGTVQWISVITTLLAMLLGQYLIIWHFVNLALVEEGYGKLPLFMPIDLAFQRIGVSIQDDPLTLLFWAIALWEAFIIPRKRKLKYMQEKGQSVLGSRP